jgi:hypothetical protein
MQDRRRRLLGINFIKTACFLASLEPWDLVRLGDMATLIPLVKLE